MVASTILTAVVAHSVAEVAPSLTTPQLRILVMLRGRGRLNVSAVADGLGVDPSNASRTCDQLVVAGMITRTENRQDRRQVDLRLSRRGRSLLQRLMADRRSVYAQIVEGMAPDDRRRLAAGLEAFVQAASTVSDFDGPAADSESPSWHLDPRQ